MTKNPTQTKIEDAFPGREKNRMSDRLYTDSDPILGRQTVDLETLLQIDRELDSRLDLDQIMNTARKWITQIGNIDRVRIFILQEEDRSKLFVFPDNYTGQEYELAEQALKQSKSQIHEIGGGTQVQLVIPILYFNGPLGAFLIQRGEPFSESEINYLELLINRSATAIANAQLNHAVQRSDQDKFKFVSLVTHELRNPLTCIKGYADLLIQDVVGPINEQQRDFLNVIRRNVEWMSNLISDLADYSRIENGRLEIDREFISFQNCLDEALLNLLPKFDNKHQNLKVDIEPSLPDVYADPDRLVQIMKNLLSNAQRYTPAEGDICVVAKSKEGFVCIEVVDNGIGISPEDQAKLFSKFFRSEDLLVREEPGWGLGLYVTKRLVEIMGGDISFRSKPGKGSNFWFTIPVFDVSIAPVEI